MIASPRRIGPAPVTGERGPITAAFGRMLDFNDTASDQCRLCRQSHRSVAARTAPTVNPLPIRQSRKEETSSKQLKSPSFAAGTPSFRRREDRLWQPSSPSNVSAIADSSNETGLDPTLRLERTHQLARDMTMRHWITSFRSVAHELKVASGSLLSAPLRLCAAT